MNTHVHLFLFPRITRITADMNWLRKTTVARRCDQKTLRQRFLAQPDGQHGLRPCAANAAPFSSSQSVIISAHQWLKKSVVRMYGSLCVLCDLRVKTPIRIRVHLRRVLRSLGEEGFIRGRAIRSPELAGGESLDRLGTLSLSNGPACPEPAEGVEPVERGEGWLKK
jgi:hypothetical protein